MKYVLTCCLFLLIALGGKAQVTFTLVQPPCNSAGPDGILTATASSLTPPLDFYWYYNGQSYSQLGVNSTSSTISNYGGGGVYVSISNAGAGLTGNYQGAPPFVYNTVITPISCAAPGSAFTTVTGGASPYNFEYYDLNSSTVYSTANPGINIPVGGFGVKITDNNGCVYGTPYNGDSLYMYNGNPFVLNSTVTDANCTNGSITINSITGGAAPYTFLWSNNATTQNLTNLTTGSYNVTITDANNCSGTYYFEVFQAVTINVNTVPTPATCTSNDGAAIAFGSGGVPPYTYTWQGNVNAQSLSNLTTGIYSVTVHDANGCVGFGSAYVTASTPIVVNYTSTTSQCNAPTGSATLTVTGGTMPYTITWNTSPVQTGYTLSNVPAGTYSFDVLDAAGCVQTGIVSISPVGWVYVTATGTNPTCIQTNGSINTSAVGGVTPYTYSWSNAATTQNLSNIGAGSYMVTVTDANSCTGYSYVQLFPTSPINLSVSVTPTSCIYSNDGSISANAMGGVPPYTWNSGSATMNNLTQGGYQVYVSDANGCTKSQYATVGCNNSSTACYCTITGVVYEDLNANCVRDAGEPGIHNIQVHCSPFGYQYTDATGHYSFKVPSGNYTVSESILYQYPLAPCQNNNNTVNVVASTGCTQTVDFANVINPLHDVKINTWNFTLPIPGFGYTQKLIIANMGTVTETSVLSGYKTDGQLGSANFFPGGTFSNSSSNWYDNAAALISLTPGQQSMHNVDYSVPTNIPLGTPLITKDTCAYQNPISNWLNDYSPWDNVNYMTSNVVGSWDPNFIEVSPKGDGPNGDIATRDSILDYMIHFQNLGNYKAQNIFILDTLDVDLDWKTLRPIYATHNYKISISETGVLKVEFPNIDLPPKTWGDEASMGMISYTIKRKNPLPLGTQFTNRAGIYFDFNAPVQTNTTLNTLAGPASTSTALLDNSQVTVYPNPVQDVLHAKLSGLKAQENILISVANISGQVISTTQITSSNGHDEITLPTDQLKPGLYFVSFQTQHGTQTKKFVKE